MRGLILGLFAVGCALAQDSLQRAEDLYNRTDYNESLALLRELSNHRAFNLMGRDYFMLGDYKKSTDAFHKAFALEPTNSEDAHWLGRAFGRRAETSNPFLAPSYASKARQYFEQAVQLDPNNGEAMNDLFDYYLQAPGFLGGGFDKAEKVAKRIASRNEAEGYFAEAQLADRRKEYDTAAEQLRRAIQAAPHQVGRVLDLAKYLARHGRVQESEEAFDRAQQLDPSCANVYFTRARVYIESKRNLNKARELLTKYLKCNLTPDDPPRAEAEQLLKQISSM
jgi:cytochrome c-type biogenesis protein CcmH/NrfG